ncbi:protein DEHYDRATION-INDUCED 19 homolog 2-like [Phragmites australis]|uniref:protein DEHYDRATION-INDUCED 19 homolog 2-like n=1 Tax=Phragmites australis TaxID=29695 RepID=UPI002D786475|nr:protein DEHYDRATION-INDUCED 19 homolog 2-like [Phragmites australis]
MNMEAYERLTAETRRRGSCFDALIGLEEVEGSDEEEEAGAVDDMPCPLCGEEFDSVELFCHMDDEHPEETKAGDKWRNRRSSYRSHSSTLALLKKDLREKNLQPLYGGSSRAAPMSTVPDPLLSSFVGHFVEVDLPKDAPQEPLDETNVGSDSMEQKAAESAEEPLLPEVKEERTRRSQFVQGLVLSLMFDDIL